MSVKVACVIVARNEEERIKTTIEGLLNQTIEIKMVVVDDGSTDQTGVISRSLGVPTLSLRFHRENYTSKPELALRFNIGLDYVRRYSPDFVLIMGGDHVLPENYVELLIQKMREGKIVIGSGTIKGQPSKSPRGSGRIIDASFWEQIYRMNYPVNYGWESWPIYKALMEGLKIQVFDELISESRETGKGPIKMRARGKGMYALGYHPVYAIHRGVSIMFKRPLSGLAMLYGYFNHGSIRKHDTFDFLRNTQRKRILEHMKIMSEVQNLCSF